MDNENLGFYELDPQQTKKIDKNEIGGKTNFADYQALNKTPIFEPPAPDPTLANLPQLDEFISDEAFFGMQEEVTDRYEKQFVALYSFLQGLLNLSGSGLQDPKRLEEHYKLGNKISENLYNSVRMRAMFGNMAKLPEGEEEPNQVKDLFTQVSQEDMVLVEKNRKQFAEAHNSSQQEQALLGLINAVPQNPSLLLPAFGFPQDSKPMQAYLIECVTAINQAFTKRG